jgi:hypothetical protein
MIQTIRLHHLLRESPSGESRCLVTRPTGAAVRNSIERALESSSCATVFLDFTEVDLLDLSCADEVVAKLLLGASSGACYVVLCNLRPDQVEAVDHVLRHHHLAVAAVPCGDGASADLLGWADEDTRAAFGSVVSTGPTTAVLLAAELNWAYDRAERALTTLATRRLARAEHGAFYPLPFQ